MAATVDSNKENATPMEVDDDPYALSSSDSEDEGPPPMIQIAGRTAAVGDLKSTLLTKPDRRPSQDDATKEELAALAKKENLAKEAFKTGQFMNEEGGLVGKEDEPKEREKLTNIDKEKYSKFKDKFEHIDEHMAKANEERRKNFPVETIHGAGQDKLDMNKERFEKGIDLLLEGQDETPKGPIVIERNEADARKAKKVFTQAKQEEPTHCAVCTKMVYPVEKLLAEKNVYHKACFRCSKCSKSLTVTNYNSHQGELLCKLHMLEVFHPEMAKNLKPDEVEEDERDMDEDEDAAYTKVSRPKKLDDSVVRSGAMPCEDLSKLSGTLSSAKTQWETSVEASHKTLKTSNIESDMIQTGKVKSRMDKFTTECDSEEDDEEDDDNADPNIIKSTKFNKKKKGEIKLETGASEILNKWQSGAVEGAEGGTEDRTGELDEIRKGLNVKERFKERTGDEKLSEEEIAARRSKLLEETTYTRTRRVPNPNEEPVPAFLRFLRHRFITSPPTSPTSVHSNSPPTSPMSTDSSKRESVFTYHQPASSPIPTHAAEYAAVFPPAQHAQFCINTTTQLNASQVSSEARERFKTGDAYQDTAPIKRTADDEIMNFKELGNVKERFEKGAIDEGHTIEKTAIDARCEGLGGIKASFEQGKAGQDESSEAKKRQIEEEFHNYKKERKRRDILDQKEKAEHAALQSPDAAPDGSSDVRQCAELGDIKKRFEEGTAFQSDEPIPRSIDPQLEIKVAKKARQKFKQIDQEAPQAPVIPSAQQAHESKWDKEAKPAPEPINKRQVVESESDSDEDFEVSKLLGKFKSLGEDKQNEQKGPKPIKRFTPPPEGYKAELESQLGERDPSVVTGAPGQEALPQSTAAAKNLKEKFEQGLKDGTEETAEQRRARLEEEFKQLKQMKEQLAEAEPEEEAPILDESKEDLGIAAEHANKMKQKWEKIQKKEAKKANKAAPHRKAESCMVCSAALQLFHMMQQTCVHPVCFVCNDKVYHAEGMDVDLRTIHKRCFRCKDCNINLRVETCCSMESGLYCRLHYAQQFNDLSKTHFDGRQSSTTMVA